MADYKGDFPVNFTSLVITWDSFAASTGAPATTTNYAAADVQIYKDGGATPRSSAAGISVNTSLNSQVGLQNILIDLSDNTDAGFYAAGHEYQVAVADVTIDGQTVRFWVAEFSIERAGGTLAIVKAALATAIAQPGQATPPAAQTLPLMTAYLYKAWRNRTKQTSSQYSLFNDDAATIDQKASFSDNGVTADRGEVATGP